MTPDDDGRDADDWRGSVGLAETLHAPAAGKPFAREQTRPAPTVPPFYEGDPVGSAGWRPRTTFFGLFAAGARALVRFPGLVGTIYLMQLAMSGGAGLLIGGLVLGAFGRRPLFDRAMDGDLAALITCMRDPALTSALLWIGIAAVLVYWALSWFMTGGLIAVLLDPPEKRRRAVARWFGAGGAASFFPFVRLALWSALPYGGVAWLLHVGLVRFEDQIETAVTLGDLARTAGASFAPVLAAHWVLATAVDYARVDLVRHPGMSSVRALLRGFVILWRRPVALVHTLIYGVVFVGVSLGYAALAGGAGAGAALAGVVALRQLTSLVRFAAHVGLIAGQVELSCSSIPAPGARRD